MNTEHHLKSKLAWSVFQEHEIKTKMVQEQWLQLKMTFLFFIGLNWLLVGGNKTLVGRRWMSKFLIGVRTPPSPPVGIPLYKLGQQVFICNEEAPCNHIHHVTKWPSYLCKIWVLCVSQIYMIYIICLFSVCNTINLSHHGHV